ncbi:MAG: FAD-dependent thymidylate synthase [Candidatus Desulfovibrio kirbyi]|uniref:FAD-dependent thymidylate synthase n=1 Tax=Candidatus Desulfovibrio kirbyi TaxID=2696086 RepID=A0A6L2R6S1_9BACT|nr:MAG: FAD-dependent thymidylate synthase [Candidatus Desulfovibrio kirbyi]
MKIIAPSSRILAMDKRLLKRIETAGRVCYKSEDRITAISAAPFVSRIIQSGHHSVLEHVCATVRIVCDRGVSHELVRHRLASCSQESTRYANYAREKFGKEITVIRPCFWKKKSPEYALWHTAMLHAERTYLALIDSGTTAHAARAVLPNSLKTELVVTCNIREWRHIFTLRCDRAAHPQMRETALPLLGKMHAFAPTLFADLFEKFQKDIEEKTWMRG